MLVSPRALSKLLVIALPWVDPAERHSVAGPGRSEYSQASFLRGCRELMAEPWQCQCSLLGDKQKWNLREIGYLFLHTQRWCPLRKCQSLCFRKEVSLEPGANLPVLQSWLCLLPRCVTLNEVLHLSVPQLHLQNGDL